MTYDKILQTGKSSAYQHCIDVDKNQGLIIKCGIGISETILHLQAPGLPLCARGRNDWRTGSRARYKDCLYGEGIQKSDQNTSKICKGHWAKLERDSDPSARVLSAKWSEAWLRRENALEKSSWNTAMIGYHRKRSCKLTGFWFLKKSGKWFMQVIV